MVHLNAAREAHERLTKLVLFLEDFETAIKFQGTHEEAKASFEGVIRKLVEESGVIKTSILELKEEFKKEQTSNQRARFSQKTLDDKQQMEIKTEINTLLERKSELEKSHEARMKATQKEYEGLIAGKKAERALEEEALQTARDDREEYKRRAASW